MSKQDHRDRAWVEDRHRLRWVDQHLGFGAEESAREVGAAVDITPGGDPKRYRPPLLQPQAPRGLLSLHASSQRLTTWREG